MSDDIYRELDSADYEDAEEQLTEALNSEEKQPDVRAEFEKWCPYPYPQDKGVIDWMWQAFKAGRDSKEG